MRVVDFYGPGLPSDLLAFDIPHSDAIYSIYLA